MKRESRLLRRARQPNRRANLGRQQRGTVVPPRRATDATAAGQIGRVKRCSHCQLGKPLQAFYRRRAAADGLQTWCKACQLAHRSGTQSTMTEARRAARNLAVVAAVEQGKPCRRCEALLPLSAYRVDSRRPDGHASSCKACLAASRRSSWAKYRAKQMVVVAGFGPGPSQGVQATGRNERENALGSGKKLRLTAPSVQPVHLVKAR